MTKCLHNYDNRNKKLHPIELNIQFKGIFYTKNFENNIVYYQFFDGEN
jgi:hypothetical protein